MICQAQRVLCLYHALLSCALHIQRCQAVVLLYVLPRMVLPTQLIEAVCFVLCRTLYQVLDGPLGVLLGPSAVQIDPSEVEVGRADALRCSALQVAQGSLEGLPLFGLRLVAKTAVIKIVNDVFGEGELGKFVA